MLMVKSMPPLMGVGVGLTGLALMLFPGGLNLLMVRVTLKLHSGLLQLRAFSSPW